MGGIGKAIAVWLALAAPVQAQEVVIAALGDSLTAGYGLPRGQGLVPQLQDWLDGRGHDARLINAGGRALFPFGGPPYLPFIAWATRTGRAWPSPVGMLVHDRAGLMISIRGAIALPHSIDLPATGPRPCETCAAPCRSACPVDALGPDGYDVVACHAYLDTDPGRDCMELGCKARRACPLSAASERVPAQSAYHMRQFHK